MKGALENVFLSPGEVAGDRLGFLEGVAMLPNSMRSRDSQPGPDS